MNKFSFFLKKPIIVFCLKCVGFFMSCVGMGYTIIVIIARSLEKAYIDREASAPVVVEFVDYLKNSFLLLAILLACGLCWFLLWQLFWPPENKMRYATVNKFAKRYLFFLLSTMGCLGFSIAFRMVDTIFSSSVVTIKKMWSFEELLNRFDDLGTAKCGQDFDAFDYLKQTKVQLVKEANGSCDKLDKLINDSLGDYYADLLDKKSTFSSVLDRLGNVSIDDLLNFAVGFEVALLFVVVVVEFFLDKGK